MRDSWSSYFSLVININKFNVLKIMEKTEMKFVKKQFLLNAFMGTETELFELVGQNGETVFTTDDAAELLDFLRK